jgi:prepilin-type N-terminal cleavage/methylation domain-containing protein
MMGRKGFSLIELVIVIAILGILAAVAIPRFIDFTTDAKMGACKRSLGIVRSAIQNYYGWKASPAGGGVAGWPSLVELTAPGTVLAGHPPDNPYSTSPTKIAVIAGTTKGTPITSGTTGGWCYNAATGEFWTDTASGAGEASW